MWILGLKGLKSIHWIVICLDAILLKRWITLCTKYNTIQAPAVQKLGSTIYWINLYPVDSAVGFPTTYTVDIDLFDG